MYRTFLPLTATLSARIDLNNVKKGRIYKISLFFEWCFNFIRPTYLFSKQPRQVENRRKFNFMNSIKKLKKGLINHNYTFKNTFFFINSYVVYVFTIYKTLCLQAVRPLQRDILPLGNKQRIFHEVTTHILCQRPRPASILHH